jgi:hypothetical protein
MNDLVELSCDELGTTNAMSVIVNQDNCHVTTSDSILDLRFNGVGNSITTNCRSLSVVMNPIGDDLALTAIHAPNADVFILGGDVIVSEAKRVNLVIHFGTIISLSKTSATISWDIHRPQDTYIKMTLNKVKGTVSGYLLLSSLDITDSYIGLEPDFSDSVNDKWTGVIGPTTIIRSTVTGFLKSGSTEVAIEGVNSIYKVCTLFYSDPIQKVHFENSFGYHQCEGYQTNNSTITGSKITNHGFSNLLLLVICSAFLITVIFTIKMYRKKYDDESMESVTLSS